MTALEQGLDQCPVIAIVRAGTAAHLPAVLSVLAGAGIAAVEVTMTTPGALNALADAVRSAPAGLVLGAGTVLDATAARAAVDAGAQYLVTPALVPEVLDAAAQAGVPVVCGALSPTEILHASRAGAAMVKVFPIGPTGGIGYLRSVRAPLPDIPLVPTGGITVTDALGYLRAGARAVGMGAPLIGDAADGGDLTALAARARSLVATLAPAGGPG